jgi:two-component system chemotaxis response regulator CheY
MTRMLLRTILHSGGYKIVGEASNGASGLELALRLKPDIICLDVMMPDTNGLAVLEQIRVQMPQMTVLMVTGKRDADTVQTALKNGAKGFIIKPFNAKTVLDTMEKAARALAQPPSQKN